MKWICMIAVGFALFQAVFASAPPLPDGLGRGAEEPAPPSGLGGEGGTGPALPPGLGGSSGGESSPPAEPPVADPFWRSLPFEGFVEARYGHRVREDPFESGTTLAEVRLQTARSGGLGAAVYRVSADWVAGEGIARDIDLRRGEGWLDLREAWVSFRATSAVDVRVGRMISTWGTGDLLFLNDLFPKDWQSFLLGRDVEYLKAPNDGVRASFFSDWLNFEVVVDPVFNPDRFIDGEEISFYNPFLGRISGRDAVLQADIPDGPEAAARAYRTVRGYEVALYGYSGFWKSPAGSTPAGKADFPALNVWGASVRGPLAGGISNAELAYYDSRDDRRGDDPFVDNSEWRFLLGHDREIATKLNLGLQWYAEWMMDYDAFRRNAPPTAAAADELRQVLSLRLTKFLLRDDLSLGGIVFYSPTDIDAFVRLTASYQWDDFWRFDLGANLFAGREDDTFYGQFQDNSSVYAAVRCRY